MEYVGDVALHCAFAINTAKEAMHPRAGLSRAHFAAAYMPPGPTDGWGLCCIEVLRFSFLILVVV